MRIHSKLYAIHPVEKGVESFREITEYVVALEKRNKELVQALTDLLENVNAQGAGWDSVYNAEMVLARKSEDAI